MRLRHLIYIISIILVSVACEDVNPLSSEYTPYLSGKYLYMGTTSLTLDASANSLQTVKISSTDVAWQFSGMSPWLSVSPSSGSGDQTPAFTAEANLSGDTTRTCVVRFESTDSEFDFIRNVSVTQNASTPYINITETAPTFTASASSKQIAIESNTKYVANVEDGASWLTATPSADFQSLILSVQENTTEGTRTALVQLVGSTTRSLTVRQAAPSTPVASDESFDFPNTGGTRQFTVSSEVSWTATTSESWIQLSPTTCGAGTSVLNIEIAPNGSVNSRSGFVYIKIAGRQVQSITIKQRGLYIETTVSSLTFTAEGSSQNLQVESNVDWEVLEKPEWIIVSPTSGTGDNKLTLMAEDNWDTKERKGNLKLGKTGTTLQTQVSITQVGRSFPNLVGSLNFGDKASTQDITVTTNGKWTVMTSAEWITVTPTSGTGDGTLHISVTENVSDNERSGAVSVTVGSVTQTVLVTQQGKYFTITPATAATLPSKGGSHSIHISSNDAWTAKSSSTWMQLSATSGTGDIDITLTAPDHPSIHERKDTTIFTPQYSQPIRVITTQAARYLTVDATSISFYAKGGMSEAVTVNTDGTYAVTTDASWLSIHQSGNTFTVTATENIDDDKRTATLNISLTGLISGETYAKEIIVSQIGLDGHDYVDLGLPSGTLWATCNIGADVPEDFGDYFTWGDTEAMDVSQYNDLTKYKFYDDPTGYISKYSFDNNSEFKDFMAELELEDDAAYVNWGKNWRMPSIDQTNELINSNYTTTIWTTRNGINGCMITSNSNGNSLFLPAAGSVSDSHKLSYVGKNGGLWTLSLDPSGSLFAWCLYFYFDSHIGTSSTRRYHGMCVRPVHIPK